ncbi:NACHT domain-containing protein, partial [candidate division KSB1 bacterium]
MIEFALVAASVIGEVGLTELVKFLKGNKKQLQKAYEKAFQNTVDWYEKTYGNQYGRKNGRFFNHHPAEEEFAKLLLLRPEPDIGLISAIKLDEEKKAPLEVIQAFVNKLRHEMRQIRECEAVLVEREKFLSLKNIEAHAATLPEYLPGMAKNIEKLTKKFVGDEKAIHSEINPNPTPIDWQELEKMFREEYRLDRLDYGHLGTSHRDQLEHKLELQKVYIALNVKDRSFDKITSAAKVKELTPTQYKNLPLLFQRFDDLIHLEREKDFKIFQAQAEIDEKQTYQIARKILHECDSNNLRHPNVILKEITTSQRLKQEQALQILALLSNSAIVPRPIAEIPAKERCHLFIGDAGGGKSTACRYMALRCFEDWRKEQSKILAEEFGITGETPLPIYLRLEDFGKMISEYAEGMLCLFQCAAKFWKHSNGKSLFTAGQLYHTLQHQPVWLFLDGLDEISNPENRMKLASVVQKLVKSNAFPQMYLTLTSRPAAINDEVLNTLSIPYFTILNLEQEQIESFAHNYFAANLLEETQDQVDQRANELIDALEAVPAAKQLTTNPLLLTVIAVLHYKEGKLPQHRAELYEKCIEQLMAQKATTPGRLETGKISFRFPPLPGKPIIDLNHNQIVDMLRDLAFHAHQRTVDEIYLNPELVLQRLRDEKNDFIPPEKKA